MRRNVINGVMYRTRIALQKARLDIVLNQHRRWPWSDVPPSVQIQPARCIVVEGLLEPVQPAGMARRTPDVFERKDRSDDLRHRLCPEGVSKNPGTRMIDLVDAPHLPLERTIGRGTYVRKPDENGTADRTVEETYECIPLPKSLYLAMGLVGSITLGSGPKTVGYVR